MFKSKQANRFLNMIAIMLMIMAVAIGVVGRNAIVTTNKFIALKDQGGSSAVDKFSNGVESEVETAMDMTGISKALEIYGQFQDSVQELENEIVQLDSYVLIVIALLFIFAIKSVVSLIPLAATCLISGFVFPFPIALLINFIGVGIILTIRYFWGMHIGEGNFSKLAQKSDAVWELIQDTKQGEGNGNPIVLFMLRIVPSIPINPVSQMYGKMGYSFPRYLLISLAGYIIKIVSFTVIGCNVDNPLSASFIIPLVAILFISGLGILIMNLVLSKVREKDQKPLQEIT